MCAIELATAKALQLFLQKSVNGLRRLLLGAVPATKFPGYNGAQLALRPTSYSTKDYSRRKSGVSVLSTISIRTITDRPDRSLFD